MTNKIKNRYNRVARFYDTLDKPMEMAASKWREKLLSGVIGKVLEVGIGTGKNIPYYSNNVELTGIDFSPKMVEIARNKAKNNPDIRILEMDALIFIPLHLYGANINRETYDNLLKSGFVPHQIKVENVWLDIVKLIRIHNYKQ